MRSRKRVIFGANTWKVEISVAYGAKDKAKPSLVAANWQELRLCWCPWWGHFSLHIKHWPFLIGGTRRLITLPTARGKPPKPSEKMSSDQCSMINKSDQTHQIGLYAVSGK